MSGVWSCRVSGAPICLANKFFRLDRHTRADVTATWKNLGFYAAAAAKFPKGLPLCDVVSRAVYPPSRPGPVPDTTSWFPMTKAIVDGFVLYGCWPDDRSSEGVRYEVFQNAMKHSAVKDPTIVIELRKVTS